MSVASNLKFFLEKRHFVINSKNVIITVSSQLHIILQALGCIMPIFAKNNFLQDISIIVA